MHSVGSPWLWAAFLAGIVILLSLDLGVFHKRDRAIGAREAMSWVLIWMSLAVAFSGFVWWRFGATRAGEYLTGWLIEQSLSVDNLFVFVLIFATFRIPEHLQHRVLYWGILTAILLRGAMILAGAALLQRFHWLLYLFGAFLLFTGAKLLIAKEDEERHLEHSLAFRSLRRVVPATSRLHGNRFFIVEHGRRVATPLFLCLGLIEISDVVFALDSVPAIFGVTLDPFIVFTSNIFAILGLRSLYFAIASLIGRFVYLKVGLSFVLIFIGLKMTASRWVEIGSFTSLAVVATMLGTSVIFSVMKTRRAGAASGPGPSSEP